MQMDQKDTQEILKLLNRQGEMIARMDERQKAMQTEIGAFRTDISDLAERVQSVENTAFRNAVITGFIGAGMGSAVTLVAGKMLG